MLFAFMIFPMRAIGSAHLILAFMTIFAEGLHYVIFHLPLSCLSDVQTLSSLLPY